jgi:hypothetical protein
MHKEMNNCHYEKIKCRNDEKTVKDFSQHFAKPESQPQIKK